MTSPLSVENISFSYPRRTALQDVSFTLPKGALCAVVGPNGAGKSTLLKCILGLQPPQQGRALFWGTALAQQRKRIAYLPQREQLDWDFPISVREVVAMGRELHKPFWQKLNTDDEQKIDAAIEQMQLTALSHQPVGQLSGGQQQRALLARAVASEAELWLLDEPLVGLDAPTENAVIALLQNVAAQGKSLLVVHHDLATLNAFSHVLLLNQSLRAFGASNDTATKVALAATYGLAQTSQPAA